MQVTLPRLPGPVALLGMVVAVGLAGLPALGANPTWRGSPFRCIYTNGTLLPDLAQASTPARVVTADTGVYLYSTVAGGRRGTTRHSAHWFDGVAWRAVLHDGMEGFTNLVSLQHAGLWERRALLLLPGTPPELQPIYRWDGSLAPWSPPGLGGTHPVVAGGRILAAEGTADAGMRLHLGPPGALVEILNDTLAPGLSGALALDGEGRTVLFATGSVARTNAAIWMRRPDGVLRRLLGEGDPLPGGSGKAAVSPGSTAAFADGSHAYLVVEEQAGGRQRDAEQVLFRSDGERVEPLLALRDPALGVDGEAVLAFVVGSVAAGEVLASATFAGGRRAVILWQHGVWTEVFDTDSSFDGEKPFDFTLHREGLLGDALSLMVSFGSSRRPVHRLYTNLPLREGSATPRWTVRLGDDRLPRFTLEGRAGIRHRILQSDDLKVWHEHGVIRVPEDGRWAFTGDGITSPEFFQARELPEE